MTNTDKETNLLVAGIFGTLIGVAFGVGIALAILGPTHNVVAALGWAIMVSVIASAIATAMIHEVIR